MTDGDTNPNMVSLGNVYTQIKDMRAENKKEHKSITGKLEAQGKDIVCLQTKWNFLRWLVPASCAAAVGIVTLAAYFLR